MLLSPGDDAINDASRQSLTQGACQKHKMLFLLNKQNLKAGPASIKITF